MTTLEFILMVVVLIGLVSAWWRSPRGLTLVPFGAAILAVVQLMTDEYSANMLPVYLVIAALCALAGSRLLRGKHPPAQPRRWFQRVLGGAGTVLGCLALFLGVRATLYQNLPPADLSGLTWSQAFEAAHKKFSRQYAFGDWKGIDWDALYAEYAPQVAAAEAQNDRQAYYRALLGYTSSIPDGHVWLEGDDFDAREAAVGAGFGLEVLALDDGRVIAVKITPGGPAEGVGVHWGAEILTWNGQPVRQALDQTPVVWPLRRGAPATLEGRRLEQLRLLVRAPAGAMASVSFRNPDGAEIQQAALTAVYDGAVAQNGDAESFRPPVEPGVILPGDIGYIKINNEHEGTGAHPEEVFRDAVRAFMDAQVTGVILDVRGNRGGDDRLVPQFVGYFFEQRELYEKISLYFQPLNTFIHRPPVLWIDPLEPYYDGPVVVLVDNATFSSGEGIPLAVSRLPQGAVIGFNGTYGSFGMTGGNIILPEGLTLHFPDGQSLDRGGQIQLDSSSTLQGGVAPTIRVPMTEEAAKAVFLNHEDFLLDYAVQYLQDSIQP